MDENIILINDSYNIVKVSAGNTLVVNEINNVINILEVPESIKVNNNEVRIVSVGIQGPPGPPGDLTIYTPSSFIYGFGGLQQEYNSEFDYDSLLNYSGITPLTDLDKLSRVNYTDNSYKLLYYTGSLLSRIDFYRVGFNNIYRKDLIYNLAFQLIQIIETEIDL